METFLFWTVVITVLVVVFVVVRVERQNNKKQKDAELRKVLEEFRQVLQNIPLVVGIRKIGGKRCALESRLIGKMTGFGAKITNLTVSVEEVLECTKPSSCEYTLVGFDLDKHMCSLDLRLIHFNQDDSRIIWADSVSCSPYSTEEEFLYSLAEEILQSLVAHYVANKKE